MNQYNLKEPVKALLWCNNVRDMQSFVAQSKNVINIDMDMDKRDYGSNNLNLITRKGFVRVNQNTDYLVMGADQNIYVVSKEVFENNFELMEGVMGARMFTEQEEKVFDTQPHISISPSMNKK